MGLRTRGGAPTLRLIHGSGTDALKRTRLIVLCDALDRMEIDPETQLRVRAELAALNARSPTLRLVGVDTLNLDDGAAAPDAGNDGTHEPTEGRP